jgi:hypothetical protein
MISENTLPVSRIRRRVVPERFTIEIASTFSLRASRRASWNDGRDRTLSESSLTSSRPNGQETILRPTYTPTAKGLLNIQGTPNASGSVFADGASLCHPEISGQVQHAAWSTLTAYRRSHSVHGTRLRRPGPLGEISKPASLRAARICGPELVQKYQTSWSPGCIAMPIPSSRLTGKIVTLSPARTVSTGVLNRRWKVRALMRNTSVPSVSSSSPTGNVALTRPVTAAGTFIPPAQRRGTPAAICSWSRTGAASRVAAALKSRLFGALLR